MREGFPQRVRHWGNTGPILRRLHIGGGPVHIAFQSRLHRREPKRHENDPRQPFLPLEPQRVLIALSERQHGGAASSPGNGNLAEALDLIFPVVPKPLHLLRDNIFPEEQHVVRRAVAGTTFRVFETADPGIDRGKGYLERPQPERRITARVQLHVAKFFIFEPHIIRRSSRPKEVGACLAVTIDSASGLPRRIQPDRLRIDPPQEQRPLVTPVRLHFERSRPQRQHIFQQQCQKLASGILLIGHL